MTGAEEGVAGADAVQELAEQVAALSTEFDERLTMMTSALRDMAGTVSDLVGVVTDQERELEEFSSGRLQALTEEAQATRAQARQARRHGTEVRAAAEATVEASLALRAKADEFTDG